MNYLQIINAISVRITKLLIVHRFKRFGKRSYILRPLRLQGVSNISIGDDVYVNWKSWLAAVPVINGTSCELVIGKGSRIGNMNHIYATGSIIIGENVLTADKVYISDNLHSYERVDTPILKQGIKQIKGVKVGSGTWLGENVVVLGAHIGRNCVIGANSVVTRDIPDYSVAVGSPATVIKRFCFQTNSWIPHRE